MRHVPGQDGRAALGEAVHRGRPRPGAYLRVVEPGDVRAGDDGHAWSTARTRGVTIAERFRAWMLEPELLPRLIEADGVSEHMKEEVRQRLAARTTLVGRRGRSVPQ